MTGRVLPLLPGAVVGAHRWPWASAHPDAWGRPWSGVVRAVDDPRAWAGTLAFPVGAPDPEAVRAHVLWCRSAGLLADVVPVLWDFEAAGRRVYFETASRLRPFADDVAEWESAREAAWAVAEGTARAVARAASVRA